MRRATLLTLMATFLCGAAAAQAQGPQRQPVQLPEGNGKELVEATCGSCHSLNLLTGSGGYTREGWELVLNSMVAPPREQAAVLVDYLAKNFPEQPRPPAVLIPGIVKVTVKEWVVPSLGSRPPDPLIPSPRPTAPSGGPGNGPTCWGGSIPRREP